jgi:glycosyltransferase involved in cell wall biosynthesis
MITKNMDQTNEPKVSVILTSYNHGDYISEAIESVLDQTFQKFELIIWDDASTDSSWDIIQGYKDSRIKAFRNDVNERYIINKALLSGEVTGEYIAIHHSDDIWEPQKLEKQVEYLDSHQDIGAVFTHVQVVDEIGRQFIDEDHFYFYVFEQPNRTRHEWLRFFFTEGNVLCHPSVLIRKACFEKIGLYRYGLAQIPDFDMWVRLCMHYEIHVLQEKLLKFRVRSNEANTSGNTVEVRSRIFFEYYEVLKNFKAISSSQELIAIFPSVKSYICGDALDLDFALAMTFIVEGGFVFSKLLGMEMLYEQLGNEDSARKIKKDYGFDYFEFFKLTAKYGIPNVTLEHYESQIKSRDDELEAVKQIVTERDKYIQHLESHIKSRDDELEAAKQIVTERDKYIEHLESHIKSRDDELEAVKRIVTERDKYIEHLENHIKARDDEFEKIKQIVTERNKYIQHLESHIKSRDGIIENYRNQLEHIKNLKIYRVISLFGVDINV